MIIIEIRREMTVLWICLSLHMDQERDPAIWQYTDSDGDLDRGFLITLKYMLEYS